MWGQNKFYFLATKDLLSSLSYFNITFHFYFKCNLFQKVIFFIGLTALLGRSLLSLVITTFLVIVSATFVPPDPGPPLGPAGYSMVTHLLTRLAGLAGARAVPRWTARGAARARGDAAARVLEVEVERVGDPLQHEELLARARARVRARVRVRVGVRAKVRARAGDRSG